MICSQNWSNDVRHKAYEITTFQRERDRWRTSISRTDRRVMTCYGTTMESFITLADAPTEQDTIKHALGAIDGGDVK
jgi:hypothetical protein